MPIQETQTSDPVILFFFSFVAGPLIYYKMAKYSSVQIARPVNVAWEGKICCVLYNQSSSIVLDETSSYWSVTKTC